MAEDTLAAKIQQRLRENVSDDITVGEGKDALYLSGRVPSQAERQIAEQLTREMAAGFGVENDLVVERLLPEDRIEVDSPDLGEAELFAEDDDADEDVDDEGNPLDADFTEQPLETYGDADDEAGIEDDLPDETDTAYFAPTDPVIRTNAEGNIDFDNGFAPTASDELQVERSAEDNIPGDEALADAVRLALSEDAATTDLNLHVHVNRGVVHLRGTVQDLEDAENAESVASEVPGVRDVLDETTVEDI